MARASTVLASLLLLSITSVIAAAQARDDGIADRVLIRRTAYGVPHIKADDLVAAGYALAWVQLEDHGPRVAFGLLRGRGEMGLWFGRDSMESDFRARRTWRIAVEKYALLDRATRDIYEGFAAGVNRYIAMHPGEFPVGFVPDFTGYDIAARDVTTANPGQARAYLERLEPRTGRNGPPRSSDDADPIEEGSNAWAFAPSRTKSGRAILVRNPHLAWTAGYYEAHVTVPGMFDFYGDFRIGGPFGVIGGFNRHLGWSTTNNDPDLDEIYEFDVDPVRADHYRFEGASVPLERELVTVTFRNGSGFSTETREFWRTPLGPVIHRGDGKIRVIKVAMEDDNRGGEQFLRMMRATTLAEWKDAMRLRSRVTSNFTYADRVGNILYVWNGSVPALPHVSGGDTSAVPAKRTSDVWTRYVSWDSLPQLLNPPGGYVRNENDPPYHTNLHAVLDRSRYPANFPAPLLRLRSQLSLELVDRKNKLSLEEILTLKNSYRMLLADRVKADLIGAVRAAGATGTVAEALTMIERWDNTAAPASRGAVLFEAWWRRYTEGVSADSMYAQPWTASAPATTPRGLKDMARAAAAFVWAVDDVVKRYGKVDVAWGDIHRVRMGRTDVPVGGCSGTLGCFRVLNFRNDPDGKRSVTGGDGWVLAVEFTDTPRAWSVLAYGQSAREESPHYGDQAAMFAAGEFKRVALTEADIARETVRSYRPGR